MEETGFLERNKTNVVISILAILVIAIYFQTSGAGFINLDDNQYVTQNPMVSGGINGQALKWAFTESHSANWHPLTWISHMIDVSMFGMNAGGHHATNVIFHIVNSLLAFAAYRRLTGDFWKSAIVAALFAVHPAHVESVAWISERKDVLSTFFWLLAMIAYGSYTNERSESDFGFWRSKRYWLVVALFALGLMSKPMVVTLPFVLLLVDYWPLGSMKTLADAKRLAIEKVPMLALTVASSVITIAAQRREGAVEALDFLPLTTRIANAIVSYAAYVGMLFYPKDLAIVYPYNQDIPLPKIVGAAALIVLITAFAIWQSKSRRYLLFGWLWFLGTMVPVIGLVQVGSQSMADRYTYVPYFGLFVMLVWGAFDLAKRFSVREAAVATVLAAVIIGFTALANRQAADWRDMEVLYKSTLSRYGAVPVIAHNLCHHLMTLDRLDEAETYCRQAIESRPNYANPINTLGIIEMKRQRYDAAAELFRRTVELWPEFLLARSNLSVALSLSGKPGESEAVLAESVRISEGLGNPSIWADALVALSSAYLNKGDYQKALENISRASYASPQRADARALAARILYEMKRYDEALAAAESAIQLGSQDAKTLNTYGLILLALNRKVEAADVFNRAVKLDPNFAEARENLNKTK